MDFTFLSLNALSPRVILESHVIMVSFDYSADNKKFLTVSFLPLPSVSSFLHFWTFS